MKLSRVYGLIQGQVDLRRKEEYFMITKEFEAFAEKYNILFAVIVDLEKEVDYTFGSKDTLTYEGLYNSLFGDMEIIKKLNDSLEGQLMPQSWKQGELKCLVVKPNEKILAGLFFNDTKNAMESYKLGKQMNNELIELLRV
jgi:hypothetical protein